LDVRFHDVSRQYGLFHRQTTRNSLPGITPEAIETARREPPRQTRAWLRGRIIKSGRQSLAALDWDQIYLRDGRKISLPDPFAARESAVEKLFRLPAEDV
jgi:proteasome accessory factor A